MIFKNALFALALLHGAAAQRDKDSRRTDVRRSLAAETSGLSVRKIKSLNSNSNLKSNLDRTCFENSNLKYMLTMTRTQIA